MVLFAVIDVVVCLLGGDHRLSLRHRGVAIFAELVAISQTTHPGHTQRSHLMTADVDKTDAPVTRRCGADPPPVGSRRRRGDSGRGGSAESHRIPADGPAARCDRRGRRRHRRRAALAEPALAQQGLLSGNGVLAAAATAVADLVYIEAFPTSPLILAPFNDQLPIPKALAAGAPTSDTAAGRSRPGPGVGQQNSLGNERHQIWPSQIGYPDPIVYKIDVLLAAALLHHLAGAADRHEGQAHGLVRRRRQYLCRPAPSAPCRPARSTASTAPSPGRGSTPNTASRRSSGSRTTWTRTR